MDPQFCCRFRRGDNYFPVPGQIPQDYEVLRSQKARVQQVFMHRDVVGLHLELPPHRLPFGRAQPRRFRDFRRVGMIRIPHPDPNQWPALDKREVPHVGIARSDRH